MKMMYNGTQIKSLNVKHYEMDTNSATVQSSDLQAGVTCFARGKKIMGTGKAFSFASYGGMWTNDSWPVPSDINTIEIASTDYPIKMSVSMNNVHSVDFTSLQNIGSAFIDGTEYPITVSSTNNILTFFCEKTIWLQVFYGKDEYV